MILDTRSLFTRKLVFSTCWKAGPPWEKLSLKTWHIFVFCTDTLHPSLKKWLPRSFSIDVYLALDSVRLFRCIRCAFNDCVPHFCGTEFSRPFEWVRIKILIMLKPNNIVNRTDYTEKIGPDSLSSNIFWRIIALSGVTQAQCSIWRNLGMYCHGDRSLKSFHQRPDIKWVFHHF